MSKFKRYLGFLVWAALALPMVSVVLTSYLLAPIIALPVFVRRDAAGWFTPFQFRGHIFGAYAYIGWKLTARYQDDSPRKMFCIQINPFRKG